MVYVTQIARSFSLYLSFSVEFRISLITYWLTDISCEKSAHAMAKTSIYLARKKGHRDLPETEGINVTLA